MRRAEVGARRGRGGWTLGLGVSLPRALTGGTDVLREGARVVLRVLVTAG